MRLIRYSATTQAFSKPCDCEPAAFIAPPPLEIPDGQQYPAEIPAVRHRSRAAAVCLGIYICAAVLGWGLVDVALAVWLP